jgi:hypothetical protein
VPGMPGMQTRLGIFSRLEQIVLKTCDRIS